MEQLLWDFPEVDLRPHQRDQVHFQPLLTGSGELLFLILRIRKANALRDPRTPSALCWPVTTLQAGSQVCPAVDTLKPFLPNTQNAADNIFGMFAMLLAMHQVDLS